MRRYLCLLLLSFTLVGCSGSGAVDSSEDATVSGVSNSDELKKQLEDIAANGSTGSATAGIPELAAQLGDPALEEDAKELAAANTPDKARAVAKKMLEKLK